MADKVTFDGVNRLIIVNQGVTALDVRIDIYSAWKRWVLAGNANFAPAFSFVGGDPLGGGRFAGTYFFLNNIKGWKLKPFEGHHDLTLVGNLYPLDPDSAFIATTDGNFTVSIRFESSSLAQAVETAGSSQSIAQAVWGISMDNVDTSEGTMGDWLKNKVLSLKKWLAR